MIKDNHLLMIHMSKSVNYPMSYTIMRVSLSGKNRIKMLISLIISAVCCFCISLFYNVIIPSMPYTVASNYIECLKLKDYDRAGMYYTNIPDSKMINKDSINSAIKDMYGHASNISIKNISPSKKPNVYEVNLILTNNGQSINESFQLFNWEKKLFGLDKKWKVIFPFEIQDVSVNGIDSSTIYVDGINSGTIENGKLEIHKIICGKHAFRAEIPGIADSEISIAEIDKNNHSITLDIKAADGFRRDMEALIKGFCDGWSEYCITRNPDKIRPYLTDNVYNEYVNDTERFNGSKYEKCEYTVNFKDITVKAKDSIIFNVDEKWHIREKITDSGMMFKINRKAVLEQIQFIGWRYHIIHGSNSWKIDSIEQLSFKQEIIE